MTPASVRGGKYSSEIHGVPFLAFIISMSFCAIVMRGGAIDPDLESTTRREVALASSGYREIRTMRVWWLRLADAAAGFLSPPIEGEKRHAISGAVIIVRSDRSVPARDRLSRAMAALIPYAPAAAGGGGLSALLPTPKGNYETFDDKPDAGPAAPPKPVPPYGRRSNFAPRSVEDFGDGGAFPEVGAPWRRGRERWRLSAGRLSRRSRLWRRWRARRRCACRLAPSARVRTCLEKVQNGHTRI